MSSASDNSRPLDSGFAEAPVRQVAEFISQALKCSSLGTFGVASGFRKCGNSGLRGVFQYHAGRDVTAIEVATDLVKVIAMDCFPAAAMVPVVDRWAPEIAGALLSDSRSRERICLLWQQLEAGGGDAAE